MTPHRVCQERAGGSGRKLISSQHSETSQGATDTGWQPRTGLCAGSN